MKDCKITKDLFQYFDPYILFLEKVPIYITTDCCKISEYILQQSVYYILAYQLNILLLVGLLNIQASLLNILVDSIMPSVLI